VIIDALPTDSIPREHLPLAAPKSGFMTIESGETVLIDQRNAARYTPYVKLAEAIPDDALLRLYQGLYPLFQQAYREMGKPLGHFSDRMIEVLDNLLATPELDGPVKVVWHINRFRYADPKLESRSAGQKTLMRMGSDNAKRIKDKLRRLRQGLAGPAGN